MADQNYYPTLSSLISFENLPLGFNFSNDFFDHIFYQNLQFQRSRYGEKASYFVEILTDSLSLNLGADSFELIINPNSSNSEESIIPIEIFYQWEILKYLGEFDTSSFSFSNNGYFNLIVSFLRINPNDLLSNAINVFIIINEGQNKIEKFITEYNNFDGNQIILQPTDDFDNLIAQLTSADINILELVYTFFIINTESDPFLNTQKLFSVWLGNFSLDSLENLIIPSFRLTVNSLSLGLTFPRTWLKPVDENGNVIEGNLKSMLVYNVGGLIYDSKQGFDFIEADSFDLTPSQIGNTGLLIEVTGVKLDLRTDSNIPEAVEDG